MEIVKKLEQNQALLILSGRLDTTTSSQLESAVMEYIPLCQRLVLDLAGVEYLSSAGLRVILKAHKGMAGKDGMALRNVSENVMEILEITGFIQILTLE